jgi:hypothetical protein
VPVVSEIGPRPSELLLFATTVAAAIVVVPW